jgi:hypothetical protein
MEVIEIGNYFVNVENNMLTVSFRMRGDDENSLREDVIEYSYLSEFGYNNTLIIDEFDVFDDDLDDWEEDMFESDDVFIDDYDLLAFLNEYYVVFPNRIPTKESI